MTAAATTTKRNEIVRITIQRIEKGMVLKSAVRGGKTKLPDSVEASRVLCLVAPPASPQQTKRLFAPCPEFGFLRNAEPE